MNLGYNCLIHKLHKLKKVNSTQFTNEKRMSVFYSISYSYIAHCNYRSLFNLRVKSMTVRTMQIIALCGFLFIRRYSAEGILHKSFLNNSLDGSVFSWWTVWFSLLSECFYCLFGDHLEFVLSMWISVFIIFWVLVVIFRLGFILLVYLEKVW